VAAFCSTVAGYVSIKAYEDWGGYNNSGSGQHQSDLMNVSMCSNHSTLTNFSSLSQQQLNISGQHSQSATSVASSSSHSGGIVPKQPSPRFFSSAYLTTNISEQNCFSIRSRSADALLQPVVGRYEKGSNLVDNKIRLLKDQVSAFDVSLLFGDI